MRTSKRDFAWVAKYWPGYAAMLAVVVGGLHAAYLARNKQFSMLVMIRYE